MHNVMHACCQWICHANANAKSVDKSIKNLLSLMRKGCNPYFRSIPLKECNRAWFDGAGDRLQVPRRTLQIRSFLSWPALTIQNHFSTSSCCTRMEASINGDRFLLFFENICEAFERKVNVPRWDMWLQHENVMPRTCSTLA